MIYTVNDFRHKTFIDVYNVYEVFQNYFGKASVDLQGLPSDDDIAQAFRSAEIPVHEDGKDYEADDRIFDSVAMSYRSIRPFILVYWPVVKVTNEYDKYIVIYDLFAKIQLDANGMIPVEYSAFTLNRSTYTLEQWGSGYMHSHVNVLPKDNLQAFQNPCLGSGPIKDTIHSLKSSFSEGFDEIKWMLFCEELARYVTVESIAGVPYYHLEEVHLHEALPGYGKFNHEKANLILYKFNNTFSDTSLQEFITYYLENGHLAISYQHGTFCVGMSYYEYIIDISNAFIDWFNGNFDEKFPVSLLFSNNIINRAVVAGGKFFNPDSACNLENMRLENYIGKKVCTFQGKEVTLKIKDSVEFTPQESIVLNHTLSMYILDNIIKVINYHYTNEYTRQHWKGISGTATAISTNAHQRAYYI